MNLTKQLIRPFCMAMFFAILGQQALSQSLTLAYCYEQAELVNPIKKNEALLGSISELNLKNQSVKQYPQMLLDASASYQSDVFSLPFSVPGSDVPEIPKDQYNIALKINQSIYDGGVTKAFKAVEEADLVARQQEIKVNLYQTRAIIDDLFFGVLLLEQRKDVLAALQEELTNQLTRVQAGYENGITLESSVKSMRIELLKIEQQIESVVMNAAAMRTALGNWIGQEVGDDIVLVSPTGAVEQEIFRPELLLFENKHDQMDAQRKLLAASSKPKLLGFGNFGLGRPNPMNFFETDFEPYFIVGAKLVWSLPVWGETGRKQQTVSLNQQMIATQKEQFVRGITNQSLTLKAQIDALDLTLGKDQTLIQLQSEVAEDAQLQFEEGTMSSTDYLTELNKKAQLQLAMQVHKIEQLKLQSQLATLKGNEP
ncbi:MAG: TolC family protein [Cyclobacteriaceae bacterium]